MTLGIERELEERAGDPDGDGCARKVGAGKVDAACAQIDLSTGRAGQAPATGRFEAIDPPGKGRDPARGAESVSLTLATDGWSIQNASLHQ
jgi:hypothetical protein